jgi:hypothetical protein
MKSILWQTLAAAAFAAASFAVAAATAKPVEAGENTKRPQIAKRVDKSQVETDRLPKAATDLRLTDRRVRDGVADGSLTPGEVKRLNELMERIEIMKRMVRNDENVSGWERYQMKDIRAQMSRRIIRERNDGQFRFSPRYVARRLEQGLSEGTITRREADVFRASQQRIQVFAKAAGDDGVISRKERAVMLISQRRLAVELNHARRYGPYRQALGSSDFKGVLKKGLVQGRITRGEARRLLVADRRFRAMMKNASADGRITRSERQRLLRARSDMSRPNRRARYASNGRGRGFGNGSGREAARNFGNAARSYTRSLGSGMRKMGRFFGGGR